MTTNYDQVVYPSRTASQTHPTRVAVVANLFGLDPAPPESCRVLEIGCGDGNNLLPLAFAHPESQFVGLDLARTRIELGKQRASDLGLKNLELHHADILEWPLEGERFDYVIAHGVYSWVPSSVRDRLLAICRAKLAPQGVAYISYNCLPGCHIRRMVREVMRFHIRSLSNPEEQTRQAIAVCRFIAGSMTEPNTYQRVFQEQLEQIQRCGAGHLFHDDLAEINDPVHFHEFASHAARHGLKFLAEADFCEMQDNGFSDETRKHLRGMETDRLSREQYLDFLKCRRFRQTLLCHVETDLALPARVEAVERFFVASGAVSESIEHDPQGLPIERFKSPRGGSLEVSSPLARRALHLLIDRAPATLSFAELLAASVSAAGGDDPVYPEGHLQEALLSAYRVGVVDFYRAPVYCAANSGPRPVSSRFVRWQLQHDSNITTLSGTNFRVEDDTLRRLLLSMDGSRTQAEIAETLFQSVDISKFESGCASERFQKELSKLGRLGLLEA